MNEKVTVVLPIYNVEQYLQRCIKSVISQTYTNLEILLIDDGSTDHCSEICDEWEKKDQRVKTIHKKNAGLGMARNTGLENASGEYICFFDSDDYIKSDSIEKFVDYMERYDADVVFGGFSRVSVNNEVIDKPVNKQVQVFRDVSIKNNMLSQLFYSQNKKSALFNYPFTAWSGFYRLDTLKKHNWKFVSERKIVSEDYYSLIELFSFVKTVVFIPFEFYYYCDNENSLTHTYDENRFEKNNTFYLETKKMMKSKDYSKKIIDQMGILYFNNVLGALSTIQKAAMSKHKKNLQFNRIINDKNFQYAVRHIEYKDLMAKKRILKYLIQIKAIKPIKFLFAIKYR